VALRVYEQLAGEPEGAGEESGAGAGVSRRRAMPPCRAGGLASGRVGREVVQCGSSACGGVRRLPVNKSRKAETDPGTVRRVLKKKNGTVRRVAGY
jgi:hypothetical protein